MKLDEIINKVESIEAFREPTRFGWNYIIKTLIWHKVFISDTFLEDEMFPSCSIVDRIHEKTEIPCESLVDIVYGMLHHETK